MKPDKNIALAFVRAFTGDESTAMRLATIVDRDSQAGQVGEKSGTIIALWPEIVGAQRDNRGVFVFPNAMAEIEGYVNASNVTEYRAHFADFDKGFPATWHREPNILVKTSVKDGVQKGQAYWLTAPALPADWRHNQKRILSFYGDDQSVSDPARRLRLPGTLHLKDPEHPQLVTFEVLGEPDPRLFGLPTSAEVAEGTPELPSRVHTISAPADWHSQHKPESVRRMFAHVDCGMRDNYPGWVGRIKLLAEQGITLTEEVPDDWWLETAMLYCDGSLRRQYLDKNFPTPSTFKDSTPGEVKAMFERAGQDNGSGKYTVQSLYLDAVEEGYHGPFNEQPASEIFKGLKSLEAGHTVLAIPAKYRRSSRLRTEKPEVSADDLDWSRPRTSKRDPFEPAEIKDMLDTTTRFDKRNSGDARCKAACAVFITAAIRRGYTPNEIYGLMIEAGDSRHMASLRDSNNPDAAIRGLIVSILNRLNDDLSRTVIRIVAGQEATTVDAIERAMVDQHVPIFESDLNVVTPGEFTFKNRKGEDVTTMRLLDVTAPSFMDLLNRSVELQKFNGTEQAFVPTDCPPNIAQNFMKRQGAHLLRPIGGLTLIPILRPDGSILTTAGYDVDTAMLYDPCGITYPEVPAHPDKDDAAASLKFLLDPLRLVPFETEDARAVMASGLLSLLARRVVDNVPLHAFDATAPGSGKTLAVDSASVLATGETAQHMTLFDNDTENAKGLGALLKQGAALISYDNVNVPLGFSTLEKALTAERPQDRILGVSQTFVATNNAVMFANGNNFHVKGDMPRRTLVARIDTQEEHPERRTFQFHPLDLYRRDRPRHVLAALTVLRAYILAGLPERPKSFGSFEMWSDLVRGSLLWLGLGDPVTTQVKLMDDDLPKQRFAYLLEKWQACGPSLYEATTQDISKAIMVSDAGEAHRAFADAIKEVAESKDGNLDMRLFGKYLEDNAGRIVEGRRIEPAGIRAGRRKWRLHSAHH